MENDKKLFIKLKITSLLDLALLIPSTYSDTTLSSSLQVGELATVEATVEDVSTTNGKLRVNFLLSSFGKRVSSIFFHTTPYHYKLFAKGSTHFLLGKISEYRGQLQISQPKSIKEPNTIEPKYKTAIKESELKDMIKKYISKNSLIEHGLLEDEASAIIELHNPHSLSNIYDNNSIKKPILDMLKFVESYNHIQKLNKKRTDYPAMMPLNGDIKDFISNLPFELTNEQKLAIEDIRHNLSNETKATKRMVVGDVGSGKTMVILASAMMAYPQKSILMAPTSLLALQIYEEATKHLPDYISIALVSQKGSQGDYTTADFIIGTHALLYKDDLPKAPLIMVDEQHRFGSRQRQSLESMMGDDHSIRPHFIQFSATPIPRTQAMMDSALIDISLITTTPFDREVTTEVIGKENFPSLLRHIEEEITKGHQTLIIYPLVTSSEAIPYKSLEESSEYWDSRFDNVYVTHGKDREKENKLVEFRDKGDILLATTVVEVGISLPRLTTIVIVGAERLGLATLHQLRGRVGRNGLASSCYLFTNNIEQNRKPSSRLGRFCHTTSGFDIAKLDLKFRNSGDILDGTIQSGEKFRWLDMAEDEDIIQSAKSRANK